MQMTQWCSLLCTGNEAVGDLSIPVNGERMDVPVCQECLETIRDNPKEALARITGTVVDS